MKPRHLTLRQADRERTEEHEFIFLGPVPCDEPCIPCGYKDLDSSIIECEVLINQLRRVYGPEPEGCEFFVLEQTHEFGIYHEAAIWFRNVNDSDETEEDSESFDYASKCELLPDNWDFEALAELREAGHINYQPAKVVKMNVA